jgi:hypothetical protein
MALVWHNLRDDTGECDILTEHYSEPLRSGDGAKAIFQRWYISSSALHRALSSLIDTPAHSRCFFENENHCACRVSSTAVPLSNCRYYSRPSLPGIWRDAIKCDGSGSCRQYTNTVATAVANHLYDAATLAQQQDDIDTSYGSVLG